MSYLRLIMAAGAATADDDDGFLGQMIPDKQPTREQCLINYRHQFWNKNYRHTKFKKEAKGIEKRRTPAEALATTIPGLKGILNLLESGTRVVIIYICQ